jgi:DNA polymerase elongation subunit (family B)
VTRIFLDVETYSPGPRPTYDDRIIAIAYKPEGGYVTVLKEWESDEKKILTRFLEEIKRIDRLNIIGHNILRFDIPSSSAAPQPTASPPQASSHDSYSTPTPSTLYRPSYSQTDS